MDQQQIVNVLLGSGVCGVFAMIFMYAIWKLFTVSNSTQQQLFETYRQDMTAARKDTLEQVGKVLELNRQSMAEMASVLRDNTNELKEMTGALNEVLHIQRSQIGSK